MGRTQEEIKQTRLVSLLEAIKQAKPATDLKALRSECFDKFGMSPTLTDKYLKELVNMGKIELDVENNIVKFKGLSRGK